MKLKNKILNWIDFKIEVKNQVFTKELLNNNLNKFWSEIVETKLSENQHIWLLYRIKWSNGDYVTIGKLQRLNKEDKTYISNFILNEIEDKSEYYKSSNMLAMIFSYNIKKGRAKEKIVLENTNLQYQDYQHHKLPITMDPLKYGKLIKQNNNEYWVQINKTNTAIIILDNNQNKVEIFRSGDLTYKYIDEKVNNNTFIRMLDNKKFTFKDNKLILFTLNKKVDFIEQLKKADNLQNKFITMDIETFIKNNDHVPYCISWFDGVNTSSYYLTDFKDSDTMIIACIKELIIRKYDNYKIYIHNLAGFDGNFLLKILANLGTIKPIIHDNKIISVTFKMNGYIITFKDSLQMLNASLRDLGESFRVVTQKSIFPYTFVNENKFKYNAWVPDFKYFDVSKTEYLDYCNEFKGKSWNLENETVRYCVNDCISLHEILVKFNELIFERFEINIHKFPTLSSLAFAIFRTHYLNKNTIPQLSGAIARDIRQSYTGGAVDMFIPENPDNTKVFAYDVNALYPFSMDERMMPMGNPVFFNGDIRAIDPNAFGFFYCKITTPTDLEHPIIQTHVKSDGITRTIAPLGEWYDTLFSPEIDNAINFGYKFEILRGYTFNSKILFKEYVDTLYKLRSEYPRSNPLNYIAKLLMNSLYGRFGMIDRFPDITIFDDKKTFSEFMKDPNQEVLNTTSLGEKLMVQHRSEDKDQKTELYGNLETHNTNVAVASAITAYARIHMSQFKNNPDYILYYTDTDSAYFDKVLPDNLVNSKILGKMKLENILDKVIFLAPKMYYLVTETNNHIYKVKGLTHKVKLTLRDFEKLLFKDSFLKKEQSKWRRNLSEGKISILNEVYTLQVTTNKRKLIYENGKLIGTKPYIINTNKEIINK